MTRPPGSRHRLGLLRGSPYYMPLVRKTKGLLTSQVGKHAEGRTKQDRDLRGARTTHYRRIDDIMPKDPIEARRIKREATKYVLIVGHLYKRAIKGVHKGASRNQIGGRVLARKIACAGFYWPTLKRDSLAFWYADQHQAPPEQLHLMTSPWPFYMWGVGILGPFPLAASQVKFLLVVVDYFTKWIEVELVATISVERAISNGQVEATNRVILRGAMIHSIQSHHTALDHLGDPILPYIWGGCNDPS
ncbi:Gypsy retrotransposon integrase-like protein 1, partial [Mucuna pruriens]